jgi:aryl-alcohol dehydrogenase-like predicted oxidoreductase
MQYRTLGHSGISVSALSLGSWMTFETMAEEDALAVIRAGLDAGINFLDDARYNDVTGTAPLKTGYSEVLFGRLLRQTGRRREDLVIANKFWFEFYPGESIEAELDGSLSRLQMDYLDIVYCAELPASLRLADMIREIAAVIASGKLRAWGVLNWSPQQIAKAVEVARANGWPPPSGAQLAYSVVARSPVEDERMSSICDAGVGIVASYSLQGGLLSGKYQAGGAAGRLAGALADPHVQSLLPKVGPFTAIARDLGCTPSQLAFAYCLKNPHVSSVVFGARQVAQLQENLGALDVLPRLDDGVMRALRSL